MGDPTDQATAEPLPGFDGSDPSPSDEATKQEPRRRRRTTGPNDCENPHHDWATPAIAVMTTLPPTVCICGNPDRHEVRTTERRCRDCVLNRLITRDGYFSVEPMPGSEDELAATMEAARLFREGVE